MKYQYTELIVSFITLKYRRHKFFGYTATLLKWYRWLLELNRYVYSSLFNSKTKLLPFQKRSLLILFSYFMYALKKSGFFIRLAYCNRTSQFRKISFLVQFTVSYLILNWNSFKRNYTQRTSSSFNTSHAVNKVKTCHVV